MQREALVDVFLRVRRPGGGEVDEDHADRRAHLSGIGGARGLVGEEIHVVEAGGAAAQHLGHRQPRAVVNEFGADPGAFGRPDVISQPLHQRQIVGKAAEQTHRRVGVGVDEAGDQRVFGQIKFDVGVITPPRLGAGDDRMDAAVFDGEAMVFVNGVVGFHRNDPAGVYQRVDLVHKSDAVRASREYTASHNARQSGAVIQSGGCGCEVDAESTASW